MQAALKQVSIGMSNPIELAILGSLVLNVTYAELAERSPSFASKVTEQEYLRYAAEVFGILNPAGLFNDMGHLNTESYLFTAANDQG
jgi:hypothetical protein